MKGAVTRNPIQSFFLLILVVTIVSNSVFFLFIARDEKKPEVNFSTHLRWDDATFPELPTRHFLNADLAKLILEKLDVFERIDPAKLDKGKYKLNFLELIPDFDYCKKHREYMVHHPEMIFEQKNFISTKESLVRDRVLPRIGTVVQPEVWLERGGKVNGKPKYHLKPEINGIVVYRWDQYRALGYQYSCLSQQSSVIPGYYYLARKDRVGKEMMIYAKNYADSGRKQCFDNEKFFPQTWLLKSKESCKEFFDIFNSEEYQRLKKERGVVYIRKIGAFSHRAEGVFPVDNKDEKFVRELYNNGTECGKIRKNFIIQYFVHNPLTLKGRKFDMRTYLYVASTNPLMAYYADGYCRVALPQYKPADSQSFESLITNTMLAKKTWDAAAKNGTINGMTEDEIQVDHMWNFTRLGKFLYETGRVSDPNWLHNYLYPELRRANAHLLRATQHHFKQMSSLFQLMGTDYMLDENLNLWLIEVNSHPSLGGYTKEYLVYIPEMLIDHFEIVFGLLKSRMKRVIAYVNEIIQKGEFEMTSKNEVKIKNLEKKRQEFKNLSRNAWEPEFRPSPKNRFQTVVDENMHGVDRYFGLIKEECL